MSKHSKKSSAPLGDPSAADAFTTVEVPIELWQAEPAEHDYPAADSYLRLITTPEAAKKLVNKLQDAQLAHHPAKDVLRAAQLPLLPMDDPAVKRDITEVVQGKSCHLCSLSVVTSLQELPSPSPTDTTASARVTT